MKRLDKQFYNSSAIELAPEFIGKTLCRRIDNEIFRYTITETECYYGVEDTACHASKGKTERTKVMFEEGGVAYIYLCYGMHYMLNIVTGKKDHPEAVLIRAVNGAIGPGRVTKLLQINKSLNGENLITSNNLWIEDDGSVPEYTASKRIGISYASKTDQDRLWRYILKEKC